MINPNFNFLKEEHFPDLLENILHEVGAQICNYARGYFSYVVTTASHEDVITDASLYIMVPAISFDYRILNLEYIDVENVKIQLFATRTKKVEDRIVNIKSGRDMIDKELNELLSSSIVNEHFKFLINQIHMKREFRTE